jgi:hypothetical protein
MDLIEAGNLARRILQDQLAGEEVDDLGLEEIEFDQTGKAWRATVWFSPGPDRAKRLRQITIPDADADNTVLSITNP